MYYLMVVQCVSVQDCITNEQSYFNNIIEEAYSQMGTGNMSLLFIAL